MQERKPVLTKMDFVRRYKEGEFGNASPTWDTYAEWNRSDWPHQHPDNLYHIRNRVAGGATFYDVAPNRLELYWRNVAKAEGERNLYISAMAPTDKTLFQGEVQQSIDHLDLTYTTVKKPMRDALREHTQYAQGSAAESLLQHYLCWNSYAWIKQLLEWYPFHIVEFSTYGVHWGTLPNYNTVFWEVRKY